MPGIRPLSPELEAIARKELNEVPERREQDIAHIKEWLERQPHLNARTDDQFLLMFLRGCKFSLERTKEKLDAFYTLRTAVPELYSRRDPMLPELQKFLKDGAILPLGLDADGNDVWLGNFKVFDPHKDKMEDYFKLAFMVTEVLLLESDNAIICGQNALMDFSGTSVGNAVQCTPALIKKILACWQQGYPVRPQAINALNLPPFFEAVLNFGKGLLKEKIRKRLFINPSMEELKENGLKPILPEEYGGDGGPIADIAAATKAKLESYRDYFLEDEKYRADESRRPGKPKTQEDLFGMAGSFRKLGVD